MVVGGEVGVEEGVVEVVGEVGVAATMDQGKPRSSATSALGHMTVGNSL